MVIMAVITASQLMAGSLITADKEKIAYCHYRNNHKNVVVIAHGFYNSKDSVSLQSLGNYLLDKYDVFIFDFRGHGESSGTFNWTAKEDEDLKAVLGYLRDKYEKIGLIAFSLGASISINVLAKEPLANSLICVSGCSDFDKIDYKLWELDWENDIVYTLLTKEGRKGKGVIPGPFWLDKKKPIESVKKITIPIFYIHGDKDWVIKPWHSQSLYEATTSKKKIEIIKGGQHAEYLMRKFPKKIVKLVKDWFGETLK